MTVKYLGDCYDFLSENCKENYDGDVNIYIQWERHLLYACPSAYRVPVDMKFRDFLEQLFRPDYHAHPDTTALDFEQCEWKLDKIPWRPHFDKSLLENGLGHMDYIQFASPDLDGMHGVGN